MIRFSIIILMKNGKPIYAADKPEYIRARVVKKLLWSGLTPQQVEATKWVTIDDPTFPFVAQKLVSPDLTDEFVICRVEMN